jgi:hypothetical protein
MMSTRRLMMAAALAVTLGAASTVEGAVILVDNTNPQSIPGLTGFSTTGAMMSGMSVTAVFDTFTETRAWGTTGPTAGGVSGSGWALTEVGDTFGGTWSFVNSGAGLLTRLILDGISGLTVFDKTNPSFGTDGSAQGLDFVTNLAGDATIVATYRNPVAIGAAGAVGDIFHVVDVSFVGLSAGGVRTNFQFNQDTDNDSRFTVPEPGLTVLFGLGLLGAGRARRRRSR